MSVFGSIAYAMVLDEKKDKLDVKRIKCVFLIYFEGMKVYKANVFGSKEMHKK